MDLQDPQSCERLVQNGRDRLGGIDLLINNAAEAAFCSFQTQSAEQLRRMMEINLLAPMLLARAAIPHLQAGGRIVNIGSVFGSIGFPYHVAYSATKFGLRGFSEALRRELRDCGIGVTYVAPRATQTRMNSAAVHRYAERVRMKFDEPEQVAAQILNAVERGKSECVLGQPEGFFAKLNALLPGVVNLALRDHAYAARVVLEQTTTDVSMELRGLNKG